MQGILAAASIPCAGQAGGHGKTLQRWDFRPISLVVVGGDDLEIGRSGLKWGICGRAGKGAGRVLLPSF